MKYPIRFAWHGLLPCLLAWSAYAAAPGSAPGGSASSVVRRFALAIGANNGGQDRETLLYAGSDAGTFGKILGEMGGVVPGDAEVIDNPKPAELDAALAALRRRVAGVRAGKPSSQGRTEVIIYYSGHADDRGLLLGGESFTYDRFRRKIDSIPADVRIAVLDACASGAITRLKGGLKRPAFTVDASSDMRGYAFITSSSPEEASQESDQIKGSFFTHYLVSGMRGAADVSGDGKVTLGEAYQFAFHETLARTERTKGGAQHPAYDMKLSGTGDVVMTDMRQTSAGLVLEKDLEGRFFIRNSDNQLVAELYKPQGRVVELGLPAGSYSIALEQRKALSTSSMELPEGGRKALAAADFNPVTREASTSRGGPAKDAANSPAPAAPGYGMEIQDQADIPVARNGKGTLSMGILLNRQRQDFNGLQLTLFFNHASRLMQGGQVSVFGNIAQGPMNGAQLSAFGNISLDSFRGGQGAALFNFALEGVRGGQGAAILNVASGIQGGQGAAVVNMNLGKTMGGQGAGVVNLGMGLKGGQGAGVANLNFGAAQGGQGAGVLNVSGGMQGGQGAGVININYGKLRGGQGAGVVNYSQGVDGAQAAGVMNLSIGKVSGAQVAGVVNAAGHVQGFQGAAVLNVAGDVEGFQFGLVNISRDYKKGIPIGLLNYSHTGLHNVSLWTDELGYQHSTLLTGTRSYYTYFSIGERVLSRRNQVALAMGLGLQRPWGRNFLSGDVGAYQLVQDWDFDTNESSDAPELYRLRLQAGREIIPYVSVVGGVSLNYLWNLSDRKDNLPWTDYPVEPFKGQYVWPGLILGIRLGR